MKDTKATRPMKWRLRAAWRPPNSDGYQGKRAATDGAIARPVAIWSGDNKKMIEKYASCWAALYGLPAGGSSRRRYITMLCQACGKMSQEVGTSRRHSGVTKSSTT